MKPTYAHLYDAGGNRLPVEYQGGRFSAVGSPMRIGVDNNSSPGSYASYASINRCGVCFAGDSAIVTPHGLKAVRSLVKGDMVSVVSREGKISASQVTCVIETELTKPTSICRLPAAAPTSTARGPSTSQRELIITERHPVAKVDSIGTIPPLNAVRWRLPNTLVAPSVSRPEYSAAGDSTVKEVFNLVLDEGHVVILEGSYLVPTLGHELEGDIVKHPFFGTSKVTECYKSNFPVEFESGKIVMKDADIEGMDKDDEDYVCAIRFKRSL